MRKQNLLKVLLPIGILLLIGSFFVGHVTNVSKPIDAFFRGLGITLIVAYFLKASVTKQFGISKEK